MNVYYCGFNGFGQVPGECKEKFCMYTPVLLPFKVLSISCAWNRLLFCAESDSYLSGIVDGEESKLLKLSTPSGKRIIQGSCSVKNTLIITDDGCCWMLPVSGTWKNISDLLKSEVDSHNGEEKFSKTHVTAEHEKIIKVCCGERISLALSNIGKAYSIPSVLDFPGKRVTDIACGFEHCIALTDTATVYTWGSGRRGQLGHDTLDDEDLPREVEMLSGLKVKMVAAGGWHSLAVTSTGDMYVWGWNSSGQLGKRCSDTPKKIGGEIFDDFFVADDGNNENVVSPGKGNDSDGIVTVQATPLPVDFPQCTDGSLITTASCGSRHTVILTDNGTAWGCGWNAYGQLASSEWNIYEKFTNIVIPGHEYQKIIDVHCGSWSTVLFVDNELRN